MKQKKPLFLVTDFYYQAKGREYFREDIELSYYLKKEFRLWISHMGDLELNRKDAFLIRNTGPKSTHTEELKKLRSHPHLILSNDLQGKGDILGKQHLVDLFRDGFPVIPSVDSLKDVARLGNSERYFVKPIDGCDSTGVQVLNYSELMNASINGFIVQPLVEFEYEVSFYFVDHEFCYALYAPDQSKRWELEPFSATNEDIQFAKRFIEWNSCKAGIQRVDACRTMNGSLALMELEDYNPFLSFSLLPAIQKSNFLDALIHSLKTQMSSDETK